MKVSIVMMFLLFVLTTALVLLDTKDWTAGFFATTLTSVIVINIFSAVLQGGLFGVAGMFPPKYTQAVMGGQVFIYSFVIFPPICIILNIIFQHLEPYAILYATFFQPSLQRWLNAPAVVLLMGTREYANLSVLSKNRFFDSPRFEENVLGVVCGMSNSIWLFCIP